MTEANTANRAAHRAALWLALIQFFFTLTWTVYVIFLPKLAAQVGIPRSWVLFILMLDQAIFAVMDFAMGVMADRVSRVLGRLGAIVLGITLASCLAFLLFPFVASLGGGAAPGTQGFAAWLLIALIVLWSAGSSALRAPPLMLLGKYAAQPAVPWLSALSLFGLGAAGAVAPYLTVALRDVDARLPFVLASVALAAATLGIMRVERALAAASGQGQEQRPADVQPGIVPPAIAPVRAQSLQGSALWFAIAALLLGLGFQIHFSLNTAPLFLRFAKPPDLEYLMPVFWIGFNLLMLPASVATRRYGGLQVMAGGAVAAALASMIAIKSTSLGLLIAMQFIAGGAWGCILMSAVTAALAIGRSQGKGQGAGQGGSEGAMTGALFSVLAVATFARMALVAAQLNTDALYAVLIQWSPPVAWGLAGLFMLMLARQRRRAEVV